MALAPGASSAAERSSTFSGSCHYEGLIRFADPIGGLPEQNRLNLAAPGTCSGWLDGRPVDGAPALFYGEAEGLMSCTQGLPAGTGWLVVEDAEIDYAFSEIRLTGVGKLEYRGMNGGALRGVGASDGDTAEQVERCAAGGGSLQQVTVHGDVAGTISG
ncbi:MAG TPA: hypothetical protein VF712_08775 [Thermoleophilaceae bacterium]